MTRRHTRAKRNPKPKRRLALQKNLCRKCEEEPVPAWREVFHGPPVHCPLGICYDCWVKAWSQVKTEIYLGHAGKRSRPEKIAAALWLTSQGHSQDEVAHILHVCSRTIRNYWAWLRKHPTTFQRIIAGF